MLWRPATCVLIALTSVRAWADTPRVSQVTRLDAHEEGAATVVRIHGSATPTFTVYKLEKPERVVVDVANAELAGGGEPFAVNSWAVGQVSAQALGGS
jgi:hypothetical protein